MNIIFKGHIYKKTIVFACKKCGCVFEATKDEYELITNQMEYIETKKSYKCKCPTCAEWAYE